MTCIQVRLGVVQEPLHLYRCFSDAFIFLFCSFQQVLPLTLSLFRISYTISFLQREHLQCIHYIIGNVIERQTGKSMTECIVSNLLSTFSREDMNCYLLVAVNQADTESSNKVHKSSAVPC